MNDVTVQRVETLTADKIAPLIDASIDEGYVFVRRLWHEYESGENRFDSGGAALFGVYEQDLLIAIGGIHRDPYLKQDGIARIRHVYVCPEHRRRGVGRLLLNVLIEHAAVQFDVLTLRTLTAHGDAFYASLGFRTDPQYESATHWLSLRSVRRTMEVMRVTKDQNGKVLEAERSPDDSSLS